MVPSQDSNPRPAVNRKSVQRHRWGPILLREGKKRGETRDGKGRVRGGDEKKEWGGKGEYVSLALGG